MQAFKSVCGLCGVMLLAACGQPAATHSDDALPGNTWNAIAQLPDWSGAWSKAPDQMQVFEDCCVPGKGNAKFTPAYQPIREAAAQAIQDGAPGGFNLAQCLPDGVPGLITHGVTFQYFFQPGRVVMLFENGEVRRIFTDGRQHTDDDKYHSVEGHSVGHWQGNMLVVDTVGMKLEASLFLTNGMKVTKDTHVVERMHLLDKDTLQIDTEVTDPTIFAEPYRFTLKFTRLLREEDFPVGCNGRDDQQSVDLTPPPEDY